MTNAFALDKRVTLQVRAAGRDALNGQSKTWANLLPGDGKMWACIKDLSGRQYVAAGGVQNPVMTEITIRRRAGVASSMRILHGEFTYDIQAVLDKGNDWTVLMCKKEVFHG